MSQDEKWMEAGLVFQGYRELDIVQIANRVVNCFEMMEQEVTGVSVLSDTAAQVSSYDHLIEMKIDEDVHVHSLHNPAEFYLSIAIQDVDAAGQTEKSQETIMAMMLKMLHFSLSPDFIKWIKDDILLNSADFVMATTQPDAPKPVRPVRRLAARASLPAVEETNEILQQRVAEDVTPGLEIQAASVAFRSVFREAGEAPTLAEGDEADDNARLRLSAWMLSIAVAVLALPIGAALIVFNLLKGENLRLTSQTAALTGTFIAFQAMGTTAQAMDTLQTFMN